MRRERRALSPSSQRQRAREAAQAMPLWRAPFARAACLSAYLAGDGELDPVFIIHRLRRAGRRIYVPVFRNKRMWFAPLDAGARLVRGRFGIPEPAGVTRRLRRLRAIDLAFVPLVAIDATGNRLGRGGGFYDRAFGSMRAAKSGTGGRWQRPVACGLAHDFQQVERLEAQPWDAPIDYLLTNYKFHVLPHPKRQDP